MTSRAALTPSASWSITLDALINQYSANYIPKNSEILILKDSIFHCIVKSLCVSNGVFVLFSYTNWCHLLWPALLEKHWAINCLTIIGSLETMQQYWFLLYVKGEGCLLIIFNLLDGWNSTRKFCRCSSKHDCCAKQILYLLLYYVANVRYLI